jgi:hypothetical protein
VRVAVLLVSAMAALSTLGVADAAATRARLTVLPKSVFHGSPITITGHGFKHGAKVTISLRRLTSSKFRRFGVTSAGRTGGFDFTKKTSRSAAVGPWVVRACQTGCKIKVTSRFYVTKIKQV